MKTMSSKMQNERRNSELRFNAMEAIRKRVIQSRTPTPNELPDEMVLGIYTTKRPDGSYGTVMLPLDGRYEADPEFSLVKEYTAKLLEMRKEDPESDMEQDYSMSGVDDIDPDQTWLLAVAEISGARTLSAAVHDPKTMEPLHQGYGVHLYFADQSTAYYLGTEEGRVKYTVSSGKLPITGYSIGHPIAPEAPLLKELVDRGMKSSLEMQEGGPLIHLANLFTVLTARPEDMQYL